MKNFLSHRVFLLLVWGMLPASYSATAHEEKSDNASNQFVGNHITEETYDIVNTFHLLSKIESIDGFTDTALIDLDDTHQIQISVRCFWDAPYRLWCADPY